MSNPELVVMLTHHDFTVSDAPAIFERCKESKARCWGMKEHPLPPQEMKRLFSQMKACGRTTFLEVVAYTEEEGLAGAELAAWCGCDVLMGTCFFDSINDYCHAHQLRYMPFVGKVTGRPSVLGGTIEGMVAEARQYVAKGAYGIDLLGYRYEGDALRMIHAFVHQVEAPVCLAGSIDSFQRLNEVKEVSPWAFTIGSAFFDNRFSVGADEAQCPVGENVTTDPYARFCRQIDLVCDFMTK